MSRLASLAKVCGSLVSRTAPARASSIFSARNVSAKIAPSIKSTQASFIHNKMSCFSTRSYSSGVFESLDKFTKRHIGSGKEEDLSAMLNQIGLKTLDELTQKAVPAQIRTQNPLQVGPERGETELLKDLKATAQQNKLLKNFIGMGYYGTITPNVILRNIIENPAWYTPYTPYQAEISQGRLESLLNYQTMVADLTGLPMSNASLLDEATAAAEAMFLTYNIAGKKKDVTFFVSELCHPQTISVVKTRAEWFNIKVVVGDHKTLDPSKHELCGALIQYPATDGSIHEYKSFVEKMHASKGLVVCATDLLALTMLTPPGEFGVDIAVGNAQRFGVPLGYGGPHAAFLATKDEYKRMMPGRIIGVSKDSRGQPAMRLSLQTREQHIRREKATSNICTAQVLLANVNAMYAVYHGPKGLRTIAEHVHSKANVVSAQVKELGYKVGEAPYFDTVRVELAKGTSAEFQQLAVKNGINVRALDNKTVTVSVDEATTKNDIAALLNVFAQANGKSANVADKLEKAQTNVTIPANFHRKSAYLTHPVFNSYHSEHEMLRYIFRLHNKDLGLVHSMIPLGSCTMKLNATAEMIPVTWPEFNSIHPFVPVDQTQGYQKMFNDLERQLADITGFHSVSLQPNAGSQGEYAGLLAIRQYQKAHGQAHRDIVLIPISAHGTNPASAMMVGLQVVPVNCDEEGNIDVPDLKAKAEKYKEKLSCIMITYPSTHGVFEGTVKEICKAVHDNGGQVYMDGANMNAQVGLTKPGKFVLVE
jgi:glycine dehydrogenase